ncbi:hypothetical protein BD626DRAFT_191292 [Schizophyllum amplum]|uniref:Uncharacterized protein n=1 Tax=Schizophyllum amplum TaxID=97359 RepID=A0A550CLU9_9AGAR|nr:hypothetical protein BD626DRAFT_191292 [Auriculariopsis ampla]
MSSDPLASVFNRAQLTPFDIAYVQYNLVVICLNFVFYGVQTGLFIAAIAVLARKGGRAWILRVAVVVLFVSSTMCAVAQARSYVILMRLYERNPPSIAAKLYHIAIVIEVSNRVNYILSDALVVWRAWVLWSHSRFAKGLLLLCMICSVVGAIFESIWLKPLDIRGDMLFPEILLPLSLFITNLVATVLVGIRVRLHRREVGLTLRPLGTGARMGGVLMLLLESGVAYCVLWAVDCAITAPRLPSEVFGRSLIFESILYLLAGIYPTFVVVLIMLHQRSTAQWMIGSHGRSLETMRFRTRFNNDPLRNSDRGAEDLAMHDMSSVPDGLDEDTFISASTPRKASTVQ